MYSKKGKNDLNCKINLAIKYLLQVGYGFLSSQSIYNLWRMISLKIRIVLDNVWNSQIIGTDTCKTKGDRVYCEDGEIRGSFFLCNRFWWYVHKTAV